MKCPLISASFHPKQEACKLSYLYGYKYEGGRNGTVATRKHHTTVSHSDGTQTVYRFTLTSLPEIISYFDEQKKLVKAKLFEWTENQWLKSIKIQDGQGQVIVQKSFTYDEFGNPISEMFSGDLIGNGNKESHEIKRQFSQDGFNLLLREEENGKIVQFSYIPGTNLLSSRFTKDQDGCHLREFRFYDEQYNLVRIVKDDGNSKSSEDLTNVTHRIVTDIHLRQEAPFLHMPESKDEKYVENGEEKLLKHIKFVYDLFGNVIQEKIYDTNGQFAYAINKEYDEQENLLSETNALGQKIIKTFDAHGREKTSTNFSQTLNQCKEYNARGQLVTVKENGEGISRTYTYAYDSQDRLIKKIDSYNNATSYTYDPVINQPVKTELPLLFSGDGKTIPVIEKSVYNILGNPILSIDSNGNSTKSRYNAYGSPIEMIYPDQTQELFRYRKDGRLESHTLPNGLTIHYQYDILGHVIEKNFLADGQSLAKETFVYKGNLLISQSDLKGHVTYYFYDGAGRKIREERCGHATSYTYDSLGFNETTCEENGDNSLYTRFSRDLLGQVLEKVQTDVTGSVLSRIVYTYDQQGNVKSIEKEINGKPAIENFTYDAYNREVLYQDALGYLTKTDYDEKTTNAFGQQVLKKTTTDPIQIAI
jgi:YD repeat-containing protein